MTDQFGSIQFLPEQRCYHILSCKQFDKLVQQHFNRDDYNVVLVEEWSNDSEHVLYGTTSNGFYTPDDKLDVRDFKAGGNFTSAGNLLCELIMESVLPAGDYLITVMW